MESPRGALPNAHNANLEDFKVKKGWFADPKIQERWDIPGKIIIKAAVSGRSAMGRALGNTYEDLKGSFPSTLREFTRGAREALTAGAAGVHFDIGQIVDSQGNELDSRMSIVEVYREMLQPLKKEFGDQLVFDVNILRGSDFEEALTPIREGLAEMAPVAAGYNREWVTEAVKVIQDHGCKPEIVIHGSGEVGLAKQRLIDTGILQKPYYFIVLIGTPMDSGFSPFSFTYLPTPYDMCKQLIAIVEQIRAIDETSVIIVCAAGRATQYLTTLATLLGLHIRVGTEDTIWKYPHRDEILEGNRDAVEGAAKMCRLLGREPATAEEYRKFVGLLR
ncbi:MAG: 3-keto-5-aminohexanoate cleavage protein [Deltaproteobacteria bacterium]|nr:3-keto-5-aminohexanoate cleavage protein [Deltaproteobacteria bacterium]